MDISAWSLNLLKAWKYLCPKISINIYYMYFDIVSLIYSNMTSNIYKIYKKKRKNINNNQLFIKVKIQQKNERKKNAAIDIYKNDILQERERGRGETFVLKMCIDEEDRAFLVAIGTIPNDDFSTRRERGKKNLIS